VTRSGLAPAPGAQGPGPLPRELLQALDLRLARRAASPLPGDHLAPGVGLGTELQQLRPYEVGDDVRQLDPAATARTGDPHVRLQVPERALTTWLVLDLSASMAFGTADRLKADVGSGVAQAVGQLAVRRGGRVALMTFGAPESPMLPPRGGRGALAAIKRAVEEGVGPDGTADPNGLSEALMRVGRMARASGLVVVISDFRDGAGWERALRRLTYRHSVLAVEISDPRESQLPAVGQLALVDPETGQVVDVNTRSARVRERFAAAERERVASLSEVFRRAQVQHIRLSTEGIWLRELGRGLK
jgi:uncharacterized protein (DUF58 family)